MAMSELTIAALESHSQPEQTETESGQTSLDSHELGISQPMSPFMFDWHVLCFISKIL